MSNDAVARLISDACEAEERCGLDELEAHAMGLPKKKAAEKSKVELFDIFVGNIANHAMLLATSMDRVKCSAVYGMDMVEIRIQARGKHPDVWDSTFLIRPDGTEEWLGNRHSAVHRYAELAAAALRRWAEVTE